MSSYFATMSGCQKLVPAGSDFNSTPCSAGLHKQCHACEAPGVTVPILCGAGLQKQKACPGLLGSLVSYAPGSHLMPGAAPLQAVCWRAWPQF